MMTATYSPDDNKLRLYVSSRLPEDLYQRVRAAGFIWAPKQDLFVAPMWTPSRADLCLELAGEIDDEDTSLTDRAEQRADRFEDYRESRTEDATYAEAAVARITDGIPLGQPILIGHHSERHARKDAERIRTGMQKAIRLWDTAQYWKRRAAGALHHAKYKQLPLVRANRIKTLEADRRKWARTDADARKFITLWAGLNRPYLGELIRPGVRSEIRRPCDDALRLQRAIQITNVDHIQILIPETTRYTSLWSALKEGRLLPREAQLRALKVHARQIAYARRWLSHLDNRIAYERAMLEDQGASALLAPKPRSLKASLPLCNYRAAGGLDIENVYHKGEFSHYAQVEMTQAEYAAINQDYKGTRVIGHSHRVRTCMQRSSLVCVFLRDAKVHPVPDAREAPARTLPEPRPCVARAADPVQERIATLKAAAQTGVQVVAAAQLFPTPPDVARQLVQLAGVLPGQRVLEPSGGTGNLIRAILGAFTSADCGRLVVVEIDLRLVVNLEQQRRLTLGATPENFAIYCADFLACNGDLGPQFDRIVMNPPFKDAIDVQHILHARELLKPGGRLAAVCANGPRQQVALRPLASSWIDLPAGSFKDAGTLVNTAIVVMDRD